MNHSCQLRWCDTPHDALDDHKEECGCPDCHQYREHRWQDWNVYPECEFCEAEMLECWADELQEAA